ncbi:MAG TPA: cytidine deaminase [Kiritimatiellia bacterium]|nr:cytidine deaminase [Kiritimatiellia bacterium]HMO98417.1 cytidine deaminase [Kiritimatiellia bacterium]HMP95835.1 cytidine deaminase [Kiritimatiellia bacterium]
MHEMAEKMIEAAIEVAARAYAPYSKFHVGAALLTHDGEIIVGCNVENASYGLTICAERNAIFAAVARNIRTFRAVAIVADGEVMPFPCGACRQVLSEFCGPATPVYVASISKPGEIKALTMGELLPHAFAFGDE